MTNLSSHSNDRQVGGQEVKGAAGGTDELTVYRQWIQRAADVCEAAANGNLEPRLLHAPTDGDLGRMLQSINLMLDITDAFVREAGACLDAAAKKRFFRRIILRGMKGSFRASSQLANLASEEMSKRSKELESLDKHREAVSSELTRIMEVVGRSAGQVLQTANTLASGAGKAAEEIQGSAQSMSDLSKASKTIGGVIAVILQIADQTKLLALNARIEAARSGEHGRGFAVVAGEVKTLAQRTSGASEQISGEVLQIQSSIKDAVEAITQAGARVEEMKRISGSTTERDGENAGGSSADSTSLIGEAAALAQQSEQLQAVVNSLVSGKA